MTELGKASVPVELDGKDALSQAEGLIGDLGKRFDEFGSVIGKGLPVLGFAAVAKGLFDIGEEFHEAEDTIRKDTGATGQALDQLVKQSQKVATTVPVSFNDAATAISILKQRLGESGPELTKLTQQSVQLADVLGEQVGPTTTEVATVLSRWHVPASQAGADLNILFRASQETGVAFDTLSDSASKSAVVFKGFGISFGDSVSILAKLQKAGINTNTVISGLRSGLSKLAEAGKDPVTAFQHLVTEIEHTHDSAKATGDAVKLFGSRAGPELAAAIKQGVFQTDALTQSIKHGHETIQGAEKDTRTFSDEWEIFGNKLKLLVEPAATAVFEAINAGLDTAVTHFGTFATVTTTVLNNLNAGFQTIKGNVPSGAFIALGAAVATFEAVQAGAEVVQSAFVASLIASGTAAAGYTVAIASLAASEGIAAAATLALGDAMETLDAFIAANPIGLIAVGLSVAVGALLLFSGGTSAMAQAERDATTATNNLGDALNALKHDSLDAKQAQLDVTRDTIAFKDAMTALVAAREKYGKGSPQYQAALLNEKQALLTLKQAQEQLHDANQRVQADQTKAHVNASKQINDLHDEAAAAENAGKKEAGRFADTASGAHLAAGKLADFAAASVDAAAKTERSNTTLTASQKRFQLLQLATADFITEFGKVPSAHQINVYYKQHLSDLEQEADGLIRKLGEIPSSKTISIFLQTHGAVPGGASSNTIFPATGGIVHGGTAGKDSVPALLTPGEMVLNRQQQSHLADVLFRGKGGGDGGANITIGVKDDVLSQILDIRVTSALDGVEREIRVGG